MILMNSLGFQGYVDYASGEVAQIMHQLEAWAYEVEHPGARIVENPLLHPTQRAVFSPEQVERAFNWYLWPGT